MKDDNNILDISKSNHITSTPGDQQLSQQTFTNEDTIVQFDAIYVYSKRINESDIRGEKIRRKIDKENILNVITSLKEIGKRKELDGFDLGQNCKMWVVELLSDFSERLENTLRCLLNDFTDSMKTRMREKDKYVISIVSNGCLLLCQTRGRESTITPTWKVVKRMLDKDNVDRFVFFVKEGNFIQVYYYEHYVSESFVNWLGIPEKEAFYYLGGTNRIYSTINGMHCALELSDDEIETLFINKQGGSFEIEKNQLILPTPVERLQIGQVRVGKKRYVSMKDFLQSFLARKYELTYYQEEYKKLVNSLEPIETQFIDDRDDLVKVVSGVERTHLTKRNPSIYILFASKINPDVIIQIRESFFGQIYTDFSNKQLVRIFHAGMKIFSPPSGPLQIRSMGLFNKLDRDDLIDDLVDFYNTLRVNDILLDKALCYSIFYLLNKKNHNKPISYFFEKFLSELALDIQESDTIIQNEGNIIEFKSRDYLVGKNEEIIDRISGDLKKKLTKHNKFKVYFFGIDEDTQKIEPVNSARFNSDRVGDIERRITNKMGENVEVSLVKFPLDKECLLLMFAISREDYDT